MPLLKQTKAKTSKAKVALQSSSETASISSLESTSPLPAPIPAGQTLLNTLSKTLQQVNSIPELIPLVMNPTPVLTHTLPTNPNQPKPVSAPLPKTYPMVKKTSTINELVPETLPLNDVRRSIPRTLENIMNQSQSVEEMENKFKTFVSSHSFTYICAIDDDALLDFCPAYIEMQGIQASSNYLFSTLQCMPDSIFSIYDVQFFKRSNQGSEIHCMYTFSGSLISQLIIENIEVLPDISFAIDGLQNLANTSLSNDHSCDSSEDSTSPYILPCTTSSSSLINLDKTHPLSSPKLLSGKKEVREDVHNNGANKKIKMNSMSSSHLISSFSTSDSSIPLPTHKKVVYNIGTYQFITYEHQNITETSLRQAIIGTNDTRFLIGEKSPFVPSFSTFGKAILVLDKSKRVKKIEFRYSASKINKTVQIKTKDNMGYDHEEEEDDEVVSEFSEEDIKRSLYQYKQQLQELIIQQTTTNTNISPEKKS